MPEVDLEFLGRQVALVLEGQRQTNTRLAVIEADVGTLKVDMGAVRDALAETATRDLLLRVLRSFEGQVELADIRTQLLRETLEARIKAAETRLDALERV
ncbi:MAG: hypothetical protein AB7I59_19615 [Geminicoccaceae bacterium]